MFGFIRALIDRLWSTATCLVNYRSGPHVLSHLGWVPWLIYTKVVRTKGLKRM